MPSATPFAVAGLVLAGGRGSRVGGADKGWIEYCGPPLIQRAMLRMQPQVDELLISANRSLLPSLRDVLSRGERRAGLWLERVNAAQVPFDDPRAFANINVASDLSTAP